mgnify:FL=1
MKNFLRSAMFAFLLTSVGAASYARKGFTTTFSFPDMADSTEVVICIHDSESGFGDFRFDTINIVGGHGVLLDEIGLDYPVQAYAFTPAGNFPFFVGNGQSELIHGTNREIADLALNYEGAPWSEDLILYNTYVDAPRGRLNKAMGNFRNLTGSQRDSIRESYNSIALTEKGLMLEHPDSWITLQRISFSMTQMPREEVQSVFNRLSSDKKNSGNGKILERYLSVSQIKDGAALSEFDIYGTDQYGRPFRLSEVEEPYIVVDFSSCYCGPCRMAAKEITGLKEKYNGIVAFVNYSCDDSEEDWRQAVTRDSITWPSVFDGTGSMGTVSLKYNVSSYPAFFVFGPERTLVRKWLGIGPAAIEAELLKILPPASAH